MKAYYYLAQAQIALHKPEEALRSSKEAHRLCVEEIYGVRGGKGASSVGPITELVLRCKKESWEKREEERLRRRGGLLNELVDALGYKRKLEIVGVRERNGGLIGSKEERELERVYEGKIEELKSTFEIAGLNGEEAKRRKVPDWCVDDITFSVMLDPVVVSLPRLFLPLKLSSKQSILCVH
jgi:STIP1 family protein 1